MEKHLTHINGEITINPDVSVKNVIYVYICNDENIQQVLWITYWLGVMKLHSHTMKKQKLFQQILMKKSKL